LLFFFSSYYLNLRGTHHSKEVDKAASGKCIVVKMKEGAKERWVASSYTWNIG
jgi:hypothetical protein